MRPDLYCHEPGLICFLCDRPGIITFIYSETKAGIVYSIPFLPCRYDSGLLCSLTGNSFWNKDCAITWMPSACALSLHSLLSVDSGLSAFLLYAGLPLTWRTGHSMILAFFAHVMFMSVLLCFCSGPTSQLLSGNMGTATSVYCCGAPLELNLKVHVSHPCVTSRKIWTLRWQVLTQLH